MSRKHLIAALAGTVLALPAAASAQQTFLTWTGTGNNNWGTAGNWNPFGIPSNGGGTTYATIIPGGGAPVISGGFTIDKFGIAPGGSITIANNSSLTVLATMPGNGDLGILSNEGIFAMNSGGNATDLRISGPAGSFATFGNIHGTVARFQTSNAQANRIYGATGNEKFIFGAETLFEGSAQIGVNQTELENFGIIRAVGSAGVTIDPNGAGMTNHGTLVAQTGPMALVNGVFRNVGSGSMVANDSQALTLSGARIEGGQFDTSISGSIVGTSSTIVDTRLNGFFRIPNNNNTTLETALTLVNSGSTLSLESGGNATDLILANNATIHGVSFNAGVVGSNTQANRIYSSSGSRLTLADTVYIRGSMQLGLNLMSLTVNPLCSVEAEGSAGLTIDPDANGVINRGTLRARNGSTLGLVNGSFDNSSGGVIVADTGGAVSTSGAVITGGLLTSGGTGFFSLVSSELNTVTSTASLNIPNNNFSWVRANIVNNAMLNLNSGGNATDLRILGDTTFGGSGVVFGSNTQANRVYAEGGVGRLTNAPGHTFRGSMQLGLNLMSITNNGLIEAVGNSGMTIDPDAGGLENNSLIRAATGSGLSLVNGVFDNADGVIHVQNDSSCSASGALIIGGQLTRDGNGHFNLFSSELRSVTNTAEVRIPNNNPGFLSVNLVNNGAVNLNSGGNTTDLRLLADTTVTGTGMILGSNTQANRIYSDGGERRLTNGPGHAIRGSMQLGANLMSLTNNGLIEAVGSSGMTIDMNADGLDNNSLIRAASGSGISITGCAIDNAQGVIVAQDAAFVSVAGAAVNGGNITTAGSGVINLLSGELSGVTSSAVVQIPNNNPGFLRTSYINNGSLNLNSAGNVTDLRIIGDTIINGAGTLNASNTQANRIYSEGGNQRLTNGASHTIRGSMQLGANLMSVTNLGVINADVSSGITIHTNADGFSNIGRVLVTGGNMAINGSPFTTSGDVVVDTGRFLQRNTGPFVQTGGTTIANGEIEVAANDYQLQGGTLSGSGRVDSNVNNSGGTVAPGNSPGTLTIEGNYVQGNGGTLSVEIGGITSGDQNDLLTILGAGSLDGTIAISLVNDFTPALGQGFTILTTQGTNSRTGAFSTIVSEDFWSIEYLHNAVVIVFNGAGSNCPADFNNDGFRNPDDLADFITCFFLDVQFPGFCPDADFNNDGFRDPDDLADFITVFFTSTC